jgi:hypothetical protein
MAEAERDARDIKERSRQREATKNEFGKLFTMADPYERARALERVLNDLFWFEELSV